jgi:mRNA interferase MazF
MQTTVSKWGNSLALRPALVLSPQNFNIATGLAAVCPITHTGTGSKFEVPIPRGARLTGYILSHHFP